MCPTWTGVVKLSASVTTRRGVRTLGCDVVATGPTTMASFVPTTRLSQQLRQTAKQVAPAREQMYLLAADEVGLVACHRSCVHCFRSAASRWTLRVRWAATWVLLCMSCCEGASSSRPPHSTSVSSSRRRSRWVCLLAASHNARHGKIRQDKNREDQTTRDAT